MKTNYIKLWTAVLIIGASLSACKKYLNVQPEDKVLETQAFSSVKGINTVLNGLYVNLAHKDLYGESLTLSTVDILAQRYNVSSFHDLYNIASYNYTAKPASTTFDGIWTRAYANILNANSFLENLEKYKGVLDANTDSLFRGEAIAMRAMLHLDILRLFGPRYNTLDSLTKSIP